MTEKNYRAIKRLDAAAQACGKASVVAVIASLGLFLFGGTLKLVSDSKKSNK